MRFLLTWSTRLVWSSWEERSKVQGVRCKVWKVWKVPR